MNRRLDRPLIALAASSLALCAIALCAAPGQPSRDAGVAGQSGAAAARDAERPLLQRRGLAMPYFSFARGVRRIGG